jgi:hypothetical protein
MELAQQDRASDTEGQVFLQLFAFRRGHPSFVVNGQALKLDVLTRRPDLLAEVIWVRGEVFRA